MANALAPRQQTSANKDKRPKVKMSDYILHADEPADRGWTAIPPEIADELLENRFFLKRRIWRSARKLRRLPLKTEP